MTKNEILYNILKLENENKKIEDLNINSVVMNSQEIENNDLFVAIRGGNNYINEALIKGAYVVYDKIDAEINEQYGNRAFYVKDSIQFLQQFAQNWRKELKTKIIGITGSNGKTTVKDMIFHLLKAKYKGKKTEGNLNNHIGLPFTLLRTEKDDDFMILEMGMSDFNEIDLLGEISKPDISIITNIGESHLEYLKTKDNVLKAKTEIVPHTKETFIINGDDKYLKNYVVKNENLKKIEVLNLKTNDFISNTQNFYYGDISFNELETKFLLKYFGQNCKQIVERNYTTNVLGEHNVLNLVIAISVAKQFNIEDKVIENEIKNIIMTNMRFQKIEKNNVIYINDAYNASPASMKKSLETFSKLYNDKCKVVVIGDMLELGENEVNYHVDLWEDVKKMNAQHIYLYGPLMKNLYKKLIENKSEKGIEEKEISYFENKVEIIQKISELEENKVILLKASRGMKLEEIIK